LFGFCTLTAPQGNVLPVQWITPKKEDRLIGAGRVDVNQAPISKLVDTQNLGGRRLKLTRDRRRQGGSLCRSEGFGHPVAGRRNGAGCRDHERDKKAAFR